MNEKLKRIMLGVGAFAALAVGGAQIAGATQSHHGGTPAKQAVSRDAEPNEAPGTESADDGQAEAPGTETADDHGGADGADQADSVGAADERKASDAALTAVPGGKVTEVSAEHRDAADKPEPGDKPDKGDEAEPAYAAKIAYDVEVTKADGARTDVHLDKAFGVLGTSAADHGGADDAGE